ncbi:MAG TPA: hypothetical protein VGN16_20980 [Acidobacteriaceae bacterium]|jgi:hypothetical protein
MPKISSAARTRLQILYGQEAARSLDLENSRASRLSWASQNVGRKIASFSDLTSAEGKTLIDTLQHALGIAQTVAPQFRSYTSKRDAQKAGTEGRRDQLHPDTTMLAGNEDVLQLIRAELTTLGWDEAKLKMFLRSKHGPNQGRDTMRTLGEANRVHFALKQISRRARENASRKELAS